MSENRLILGKIFHKSVTPFGPRKRKKKKQHQKKIKKSIAGSFRNAAPDV